MDLRTTKADGGEAVCERALSLIERVFGPEERALESVQLDGTEARENVDILVTAEEGDALAGVCHITISRSLSWLGGLSGFCVAPEARGVGVGSALCARAVSCAQARGVEALLLGTSNPVAAKLYARHGFSFVAGSNVMLRTNDGATLFDVARRLARRERGRVIHGDASFRLPVVPLSLVRGAYRLLDANAGIFSTDTMVLRSCAGTFESYRRIRRRGGDFAGYVGESGALYAIASIEPTEDGPRVDGFALPGYEEYLPRTVVSLLPDDGRACAIALRSDEAKRALFEGMGFAVRSEARFALGDARFDALLYVRSRA